MAARYRIIADDLRRRIMAGEYPSGEPLPRQFDLAEAYETKRAVIAEAVRVLEGEGMVRAVRKRGTVVQWPAVRRRIERSNKVSRDPGYTVAGITTPGAPGYNFPAAQADSWQAHGTPRASAEPCPPRAAELLRVATGARVVRRRRVTSRLAL